jgi:hypothetical protein
VEMREQKRSNGKVVIVVIGEVILFAGTVFAFTSQACHGGVVADGVGPEGLNLKRPVAEKDFAKSHVWHCIYCIPRALSQHFASPNFTERYIFPLHALHERILSRADILYGTNSLTDLGSSSTRFERYNTRIRLRHS